MNGFSRKLDAGSIKAVLIMFIVLSLIVTGIGYMFMKNREASKLEGTDHYYRAYLGVLKKEHAMLDNLHEARLNMLDYLLTHNKIKKYEALYALKEVMPSYEDWKEAIPGAFKTPEVRAALTGIRGITDSLDKSMISVLAADGHVPVFSNQSDPVDSLSQADTVYESGADGRERFASAGIDGQFDRLHRSMADFDTLLNHAMQDRVSSFHSISNVDILLGIIIAMGVIFSLFIFLLRRNINRSLWQSGQVLEKISKGEIPDRVEEKEDEFKIIRKSSNKMIDYLKDASDFALQIGEGNFKGKFRSKSEKDLLGNALIEMSDRLFKVAEEDKVRNWMNEGQAKFANILRQYGNNLQELGDQLISGLVGYLGAIQGGLFVVREEDGKPVLELLSAFAYDRKKYEKRKIRPGEGLAGQVFLERKEIYIRDLREDHFYIQTGMGTSRPVSVLIVPLMEEDNIEGVLELASLKEMDEHQIAFVKKVAESIASSLRSGKINLKTRQLLDETRQKAEEMAAQEEELRQNMEELAATQEQMERLRADEEKMRKEMEGRQNLLTGILNKMPEQVFVKDGKGKIILLNQAMAEVYGKEVEELTGMTGFESYPEEEAKKLLEEELRIISGGKAYENPEERFTGRDGKSRIVRSRKIPLEISYLGQKGLLCIRTDITETVQLKEELKDREKRMEEIEAQLRKAMGNDA